MPWQPGETGNPRGRPPKGTATADALRASIKSAEVLNTVQDLALSGDMTACRILLERVLPPLKATDLPTPITMPSDLTNAATAVLEAVAAGTLSPDQGQAMASVLASLARVKEATELEARIAGLEQKR